MHNLSDTDLQRPMFACLSLELKKWWQEGMKENKKSKKLNKDTIILHDISRL